MNFNTIATLINNQRTAPLTIRRPNPPVKDQRGAWVDSGYTAIVIGASVAHVSGAANTSDGTEYHRTTETLRVTSTERLYAAVNGGADVIEYQGALYSVDTVADHSALAGVWTAYAGRLEQAP